MSLHVFWINLESEQKRRNSFLNLQLPKTLFSTRIDAILHEKPHIGCCMSHIKAIHTAYHTLQNDTDYALIVEDDIDLSTYNDNILNTIKDVKEPWDVLQLHWIEPSLSKVLSESNLSYNVLLKGYFMSAAAYVMNHNSLKKFLSFCMDQIVPHFSIDDIGIDLTHPLCKSEEMIFRYINSYTFLIPLFNTIENQTSSICNDEEYTNRNYTNMLNLQKLKLNNYKLNYNETHHLPYDLHWINDEQKANFLISQIYKKSSPRFYTFLHSGLGNRLFQFCSIYGLAKKYNVPFDVFAVSQDYQHSSIFNSNDDIKYTSPFGVLYENCLYSNFFKLDNEFRKFTIRTNTVKDVLADPTDKLLTHHCILPSSVQVISDDKLNSETLSETKSETLFLTYIFDGFFQNESYFIEYRNELLEYFNIPQPNILLNNMIVIHVRLGDFTDVYLRQKHLVDLTNYYKRCIEIYSDYNFIIISEESRENILQYYPFLSPYTVITTGSSVGDMMLMSTYKGLICSNSTFAWWAGWFNRRRDAHITIPSKWFTDESGITTFPRMKRARIVQV